MEAFELKDLEASTRLTKWLQDTLKVSYAYGQQLIRKGSIKVNDKRIKADCRLSNGDVVAIYANIKAGATELGVQKKSPPAKLLDPLVQYLRDNILFQNDHVVAINKPYGIATQGGIGVKISIDDALGELLTGSAESRPRLVHRLDRDTTGILLLARTKEAATELTALFRDNRIMKKYLAVVVGNVAPKEGVIDAEVTKLGTDDEGKSHAGKPAMTKYRVLGNRNGISLIEFMPLTGRTHQIRIHAAKSLGTPVAGDFKYGGKNAASPKLPTKNLCLHAYEIKIKDLMGKSCHIKAPLPEHMEVTIDELGL